MLVNGAERGADRMNAERDSEAVRALSRIIPTTK